MKDYGLTSMVAYAKIDKSITYMFYMYCFYAYKKTILKEKGE